MGKEEIEPAKGGLVRAEESVERFVGLIQMRVEHISFFFFCFLFPLCLFPAFLKEIVKGRVDIGWFRAMGLRG